MIIMLCRNNLAQSKKCFETLRMQSPRVQILIIDNASTDGTATWSKSVIGNGTFLMHKQVQDSVASCWNSGIDWVFGGGHQEVLVVNNDTELRPDTYRLLLDANFHNMTTCVSVRTYEQLNCTYTPDPGRYRPHPDFSCFMLSRAAWRKVGKFDTEFVGAYFEDNDYHVRMHRAGVSAINIGLPFLHHGSGTKNSATDQQRRQIELNFNCNQLLFYKKYGCMPGTKQYEELFTAVDPVTNSQTEPGELAYSSEPLVPTEITE